MDRRFSLLNTVDPALGVAHRVTPPRTSLRHQTQSRLLTFANSALLGNFRPIIRHKSRCITTYGHAAASTQPGSEPTPEACRSLAIAVDTSQASPAACRWVLSELYRPGDTVHLLHVVPPLPHQSLYALPDGRLAMVNLANLVQNEETYLEAATKVVADWAGSLFDPDKVHFVTHVIQENAITGGSKASVARELCCMAEALGAAVLVLSSHTGGRVGEAVLGSVASDCARNCNCPVAVLHIDSPKAPGGAKWVAELLRTLGHAGTLDTAADVLAAQAAAGAIQEAAEGKGCDAGEVSSADFQSEEENLIGQAVAEFPGLQTELSADESDLPKDRATSPRHIVVTVDDSDVSERACAWAAHHLARPGDTLHLVHVIPSLPSIIQGAGALSGLGSPGMLYVMEPPTAEYKAATEEYMQRRFYGILRSSGVDFESEVLVELTDGSTGSVGQAICDRAGALGAAAVVIGSHSRGGLGEMVLGSVASYVCHHAERPVVVLH